MNIYRHGIRESCWGIAFFRLLESWVGQANHGCHQSELTMPPPSRPSPDDVVIVSALRTPMCRARKGGLAQVLPSQMMQAVFEGVLKQTRLPGEAVDDICVSNVLMPQSGYATIRMAHIAAGIPETASFMMLNRQCSGGLQACAVIANAIKAGEVTIGIGGGVESMSQVAMKSMKPMPMDWEEIQKHRVAMDCLLPMGITSETVVKEYGLSRRDLDAFSARSHQRAAAAQNAGKFDSEIVPVFNKKTHKTISQDDGVRANTTTKVLAKLRPAFIPTGATTAGNSSQTTDGAAAVLMMTRREAVQRGLDIKAVWRGFCTAGVPPRVMGIGPIAAIPKVLQLTGLRKEDIDVYEINEAFASQAAYCVDELGLQNACVNPNGGAIALGHPLGCTGARMIATLIPELERRGGRYGVISMCVGTGMGAAAVIEVEGARTRSHL